MDPVENVLEQRVIAERLVIGEYEERLDGAVLEDDARRLAELALALDDWRRDGGFDPYLAQPAILQ